MKKLFLFVLLLASCTNTTVIQQPTGIGQSNSGQQVLNCDNTTSNGNAQHINFGHMWRGCSGGMPCSPPLGHFFYEAWVAPQDSGSRYLISDGEGGQHAILWGFVQAGVGAENRLFLSVESSPSAGTQVIAGEGIVNGSWEPVGASWDGSYLRVYQSGVEVGRAAFTGPRASADPYSGNGTDFYVCGSDHSNGSMEVAEIRGFEDTDVLSYPELGYQPETRFRDQWYDGTGTFTPTNFMAMFTTPEDVVPDLSAVGYNGERHNGTLYNALNGPDRGGGNTGGYPIPGWVTDSAAPTSYGPTAPSVPYTTITPPSTPSGALVFDSFSRRDHTWAWDETPTLGSTEAGSEGALAWHSSHLYGDYPMFGVLNGRAVFTGPPLKGLAWVTPTTAPTSVAIDRLQNDVGLTGIVFRTADRSNFGFCASYGSSVLSQTIRCGYFVAGSYVFDVDYTAPATYWVTLKAVLSGTSVTVYADSTSLGTFSLDSSLTAHGAGLFQNIVGTVDGLTRWDNFTVY